MKERPIIFSEPMVRAILVGRKTQTRRVVKQVPHWQHCGRDIMEWGLSDCYTDDKGSHWLDIQTHVDDNSHDEIKCPFGAVGDRLWVRETWCVGSPFDDLAPSKLIRPRSNSRLATDYAANDTRVWGEHDQGKWRPSIHMPRWASRLTLEITAVRVERLQYISDFDAYQEGAPSKAGTITGPYCMSYKEGFRALWESIHGPGSWGANPWVWVLEFKRVEEVK